MEAPERWPDLVVLNLLVQVAEHGSLNAAAQEIGIAQPNAGRAVRQFEQARGIQLFQRSPRGSRLTEDGLTLLEPARAILQQLRSFAALTDSLRTDRIANLKVTASQTIGDFLMPRWLAELHRRDPDLAVTLRVQNSRDVLKSLWNGEFDIGFVENPGIPKGLRSTVVATDRLAVVVDPAHHWATHRSIDVDELIATPLIVREPGSGTRDSLDVALSGLKAAPPILELSSNAAIRVSVSAGAGPAVLSELVIAPWVASGELVQVEVTGVTLERRLRAVWRGPGHLDGPAVDLVRIARDPSAGTPAAARDSPSLLR